MTFNSQTELTSHKSHNHYGKADRDGQFDVCIKCGEQIKNKSMKYHMLTRHGDGPVTCPKCSKIMKNAISLDTHIKVFHDICQCEECGKVCNSKKNLQKHVLAMHTPDHLKPWKCSQCSKGFTEKARLEDHINVHLGVKPFACEQCNQRFSNASNRYAHVRSVHNGVKRTKLSKL